MRYPLVSFPFKVHELSGNLLFPAHVNRLA